MGICDETSLPRNLLLHSNGAVWRRPGERGRSRREPSVDQNGGLRSICGPANENAQDDLLGGQHEVAFERPDGRGAPGSHARLVEDVLDVVARRLGGDAEGLGDLLCPASCMIGATSGSEAKLCQPSRSQSKITQTLSVWLGSRNTSAPFEPCCLRFSAPVVEKTLVKRSKSSTVVVARSILVLLKFPASPNDAEVGASMCSRTLDGHRAIAL
jgi:hypothetical protein